MGKERIQLYFVNTNTIMEEEYKRLYHIISEDRKKKIQKYVKIEDKKSALISEVLLRYILKENNLEYQVRYNEYGKPLVKGINFNISHSGEWVVIAVSNKKVGIDIEKNIDDLVGMEIFSSNEKEYINRGKADGYLERTTEIWTKKESYLKYLGVGLYKELNSFSAISSSGEVVDAGKIINNVFIKTMSFKDNYKVSVCGECTLLKQKILTYDDLYTIIE